MKTQILLAAVACLLLVGCERPLNQIRDDAVLRASGRYLMLENVSVPPTHGPLGCGAQALAAAFRSIDDSVDVESVSEELPWHETGATPVDILIATRSRGFAATIQRGTWDALRQTIEFKQPALVMFNSAATVFDPIGAVKQQRTFHWSIVSGIALDDTALLLGAPHNRHFLIDRELFLERWADADNCMIVIGSASEDDNSVTGRDGRAQSFSAAQ